MAISSQSALYRCSRCLISVTYMSVYVRLYSVLANLYTRMVVAAQLLQWCPHLISVCNLLSIYLSAAEYETLCSLFFFPRPESARPILRSLSYAKASKTSHFSNDYPTLSSEQDRRLRKLLLSTTRTALPLAKSTVGRQNN